ncbi:MAG: Type 1 glutamine amidotransferase-like domain-containing protein [Clostridia bacterium]|nr:Type 1 glutamine amidotransferase-like domain-containing protein [Clostridia bacterium]
MNKNIIVTAGGFNSVNNYVSEDNIKLFKEIAENKKVMVLSNAAPEGTGNYIARENVRENFLGVGATEADIIDLDDSNLDLILDYDVIYILGGNTTPLIELNKNPKLKMNILKFLEKGVLIGESAGSIFLQKDAKYYYDIKKGTKPKYDVNLDTYACLGLIDIFIYPHFQKANEGMKNKISEYEKEHNIKIKRLNDGEIILY